MSRYLDPKADVVFKKIFGQHPKLLKSFLNAVLPLPQDGLIESLEYLASEEVPIIPVFKATIVDVKCTDQQGRIFIVEMQIQWSTSFMQRMLFNASKAYVRQLEKGERYNLLKPVYGLGLLDSSFDSDPNHWYHHYKILNVEKPQSEIKDLQLVFIELPKFKAQTRVAKKLQILWLRFLSELDEKTQEVPEEWLNIPEIKQAVTLAEEAAYTKEELAGYEKYWDNVSIEKTLLLDSYKSGEQAGLAKGLAQGLAKGIQQEKIAIAKSLMTTGMAIATIAQLTGLSLQELESLH